MAGTRHSVIGDIRLIRQNLDEGRYTNTDDGFPIFKELVQNADDENAKVLHLIWCDGIKDSDHPLLRGPSIAIVNDGHFDEEDAENIRSLGANAKALEVDKIGKFGLGLKSIFYFCEAFFYVAGDDTSRHSHADFWNPWSASDGQDRLHEGWDEFSNEDVERLKQKLDTFLHYPSWFCVWVPLRKQSHGQGHDPIRQLYPGDDEEPAFLVNESLPTRLASLFPLLQSLTVITADRLDGPRLSSVFSVALKDGATRRLPIEDGASARTNYMSGRAESEFNGRRHELSFFGEDVILDDAQLNQLYDSEFWPRDIGTDRSTHRVCQVKEKAYQHAGLCLTLARANPAIQGQFHFNWSVFLPLGEPTAYPLDVPGLEVSIFAHGYFFVDAGRNGPIGIGRDRSVKHNTGEEENVRLNWNQRLAGIGTMPLIPKVLAEVMVDPSAQMTNQEMASITRAIQESHLFFDFRAAMCSRDCWASLFDKQGQRSWRLFSASEHLVELPAPTEDDLPHTVFPALDELANETNITSNSDPRLVRHDSVIPWPQNIARRLLGSVPASETFERANRLFYLVEFLELLSENDQLDAHVGSVTRIARVGLGHCGIGGAPARLTHTRRLLELLPPDCRLPIDLHGEIGTSLFRQLCRHEVDLVFLPHELDSVAEPGTARLNTEDGIEILKTLAERQEGADEAAEREAISVLAAQLLQRVRNQSEVLKGVSDLPLFFAKNCRDRENHFATWTELELHRMDKTLFVLLSPRAYSLQKCLADETVLLISKECFEALFPNVEAPHCTPPLLIETLTRSETPRLAKPADRIDVLTALLGVGSDARQASAYRNCVRYLLHGEPSEFHTTLPLLVSHPGQSEVWRRITHISLTTQHAQWRLVDREFAKVLSADHKDAFDIQEIGAASAMSLIIEVGPDAFGDLQPSSAEYSTLLREIHNDELCQNMPIHEDLVGNFVAIGEGCYWQSDVPLPGGLEHSVTILRKSTDESTWRRQLELTRQLDGTALIEIIFGQDQPGQHWDVVMASLPEAHDLSDGSSQRLKSTAWLPIKDGEFVSPEDLIDLSRISDDVARLTSATPGIFYDPGMLQSAVRDHSSYDLLCREAFPEVETALSMLGELLIEDPANHIGPIHPDRLPQWCEVAGEMSDDILPCGVLISLAAQHYPASTIRVFEELTKPNISRERTQDFLDYLRQTHRLERSGRRKTSLITVFNEYLKLAIQIDGYETVLTSEQLPNRLSEWKSADELCCENDGIAASHILESATEETLAPSMPALLKEDGIAASVEGIDAGHEPDWSVIKAELGAANERLRAYFAPWQDIVPNEQIGGFLTLLGDDPGVRELAQQFLGKNRTIEETRIKFGLPRMKAGDQVEDGLTMMTKQRVVVETVQDATVRVLNLLGQKFLAPRNETPQNIFVGYGKRHYPFPHTVISGTRILCFRLNVIDPRRQNPADLSKLLRDSAVKFIANAYNSYEYQTSFGTAWDELSESDQLDISIAQERVVENGFLILDQLGLRSDPQIATVLDKWDAAQRLQAEQRSGAVARSATGSRDADAEMREAKSQLRLLLEDNRDVQSRILEAIRERVAEYYQYTKAAVPFEIFQNADDASVELLEHFSVSDDLRQNAGTFHVFSTPSQLTLAHFGRRINQYPHEALDSSMGFDNDLWKMLVLSLSNKLHNRDDEMPEVTGKFGLGFKSSYLVSERPRLLSGRLAFEVTGAMFPRRLIAEERSSLDDCRATQLEGNPQATILQLPLTDATEEEVLADFRRLVHIAVVFARRIRCCIFNGGEIEAKWQPEPVCGIPRCFSGTMSPLLADAHAADQTRALLFDSDHGSMLFAIGSRGFDAFVADVPTIWVTAPTLESLGVGFLINGSFALDVGRAQLAREFSQNRDAAAVLGISVGSQLCELFRTTMLPRGWQDVCGQMRMANDATAYEFWDSLFDLIGNAIAKRASRDAPADELVREVLWVNRDRGAVSLYRTCQALPTRMRGDYQMLVSFSQIRHALTGLLSEDLELFAVMSTWDTFKEHAPPGTVVSHEQVFEPLKQLAYFAVSHVRPLGVSTVLEWEFRFGNYVDCEAAERLGAAITKRTLDLIRERTELNELRELLDTVEFKGCDNLYHPAKELLLGHTSVLERDDRREDERFRAQFAPDSRVLSEDYQGVAVAFFDVCRDTLEAPVRLMADWVLEASDVERQIATLDYLAHGQLATGLVIELNRRGLDGTWLARLSDSEAFRSLNEATRARLLDLLPEDARPKTDWDSFFGDPHHSEPIDPEYALRDIHEWWCRNRDCAQDQFDGRTYVEEYVRRTYPNGTLAHLVSEDNGDEELRRTEWATLLLLGLMHTIGRANPGQHKKFLHNCARDGWMQMFAASEPDAERWMGFVRGYLERQIDEAEYFHWMRQFVGIFQVSRYLDDYIELFLAIERTNRPFRLTEVTQPMSSSLFQGGGISAPPISRVLGLGACFVVRELVRMGVLQNDLARQHCYVPAKRVRDIFRLLGCDGLELQSQRWEMSGNIHNFIVQHIGTEAAHFENDFDIPFQFISEDVLLQQKFFQRDVDDGDEEREKDWEQFTF